MLPIKTKPYKDESFISWFCRLSFLNGTDPKGLALYIWDENSQFYKDLDRKLSNNQIFKLTKYTQVPHKTIKKLTLEPYIKKVNSSLKDTIYNKWYFLLPLGQKGRIRTNGTSICSKCLKEKNAYINKYWRISWIIACPIHKLELISHCPNCYQAILPQKLNYLNPNIYLCNRCNYDLRKITTIIINDDLYKFQSKLLSIFKLGKITSKNKFTLLLTNSAKDLFLTLHIFLAFFHKVLRQKNRFDSLIKQLRLSTNYTFTKQNNATFNRLNIQDRTKLLNVVYTIFEWNIDEFIKVLQNAGITSVILKQTFQNISPTVEYILRQLSNRKLVRNMKKTKRSITAKNKQEVIKLFLELKPYIDNTYKFKSLKKRLIESNEKISSDLKNIDKKEKFSRPKVSHQILQKRVIYILNNLDDNRLTNEYIINSLIGYFHWIWTTSTTYIIKSSKEKSFIISFEKNEFYIPF